MRVTILLFACFFAATLHAQQESGFTKFGKINAVDLQKKLYEIDSSANAVVLSDIGHCYLQGNPKAGFRWC